MPKTLYEYEMRLSHRVDVTHMQASYVIIRELIDQYPQWKNHRWSLSLEEYHDKSATLKISVIDQDAFTPPSRTFWYFFALGVLLVILLGIPRLFGDNT